MILFLGLAERVPDSAISDDQSTDVKSLGLRWVFPFTEELLAQPREGEAPLPMTINERDYIDERRKAMTIEFKKEPPRAMTQAFDVSVHFGSSKLGHFFRTVVSLCSKGRTGATSCRSSTV